MKRRFPVVDRSSSLVPLAFSCQGLPGSLEPTAFSRAQCSAARAIAPSSLSSIIGQCGRDSWMTANVSRRPPVAASAAIPSAAYSASVSGALCHVQAPPVHPFVSLSVSFIVALLTEVKTRSTRKHTHAQRQQRRQILSQTHKSMCTHTHTHTHKITNTV